MAGGGARIIPCPGSSQAHHRSHQLINGPSPQAQVHTEEQAQSGIQIKWTPCQECPPCPRAVPGEPPAPAPRCETQDESREGSSLDCLLD